MYDEAKIQEGVKKLALVLQVLAETRLIPILWGALTVSQEELETRVRIVYDSLEAAGAFE